MMRRSIALAASSMTLVTALGCAETPAARIANQAKVVASEETPDKLFERGVGFAQIGDETRAEQYLAAAIEAGGPPDKILPVLLEVCISEHRYWAAINYAEPHLKRHPEDFRLRFVLASLYATLGETKTAEDELARVVDTKPDMPDPHYALAVLLRDESNDPVGADRHFREYLRLSPNGKHAEEARGSLLKTVP